MYAAATPIAPDRTWTERHAAWIVSICVHVLLFCWLCTRAVDLQPAPRPKLPRVRIAFQPVSLPAPRPESQPLPELDSGQAESVASSAAEPSPEATLAQAAALARRLRPGGLERAAESRTNDPAEPLDAKMSAFLESARKYAVSQRKEVFDVGKGLENRLQKARLANYAAPHFPDFKGARTGAIRTLDLRQADEPRAQELMTRYDIELTRGLVENVAPSFLSSASTRGGVYNATDKPGYYESFLISEKALRQMVWLEHTYMVSNGYDPAADYVDSVVFGPVEKEPGHWDLGILDIKIQRFSRLNERDVVTPEN